MKAIITSVLAVFLILTAGTMASAKSPSGADAIEIDGSIAPATGPGSYDGGFGINFGAGYMLSTIDRNLQARVDIAYFRFKNDFAWGSGTYTRVPFTLSARYYVPIIEKLRAFGQAGIETSIDNYDYGNAVHQRKNQLSIGLAPGAGIEFFVAPNISAFVLARAHWLSDSYASMHFGVAAYF